MIVDPELVASLDDMADRWAEAIRPHLGERLASPLPEDLADALALAAAASNAASAALSSVPGDAPESVLTRKARAQKAVLAVFEAVDIVADVPSTSVAWVEGTPDAPRLEVAPIDVGEVLARSSGRQHTVVLTSATLPAHAADPARAPSDTAGVIDVGSPFDYEDHALLYCAAHLPDPRRPGYEAALHDELEALDRRRGGPHARAVHVLAGDAGRGRRAPPPRSRYTILAQGDLPKPALVEPLHRRASDVPLRDDGLLAGHRRARDRALSLVTIDRLPFPRPDDPLLQARRERARSPSVRATIDLPRAAVLLAQATGRLIRTATDRGVVAVLDSRLAANAGYRWDLVRALPPMRRTRHRDEAETFLRALR